MQATQQQTQCTHVSFCIKIDSLSRFIFKVQHRFSLTKTIIKITTADNWLTITQVDSDKFNPLMVMNNVSNDLCKYDFDNMFSLNEIP